MFSLFSKRPRLSFSLLALITAFALVYAFGYRLGPGLSVTKLGTLVLTGLPESSVIYVDGEIRSHPRTSEDRIALLPGAHTVIISSPVHQPWNEVISITAQEETNVVPLFIQSTITVTPLQGEEVASARKIFALSPLPTEERPLSVGCTDIYISVNRIVADVTDGCTPPPFLCDGAACGPTILFNPIETILSVIPLPGREDALIVATGKSLFVLEIDPREPVFFAPLFRGQAPIAALYNENSIVIEDHGKFYTLSF